MWLLIIVFLVLLLSLGAIVAAVVVIGRNKTVQNNLDEVYVRAEVTKTDVNSKSMSVDSFNNYDHKQYFVEFRTDQGKRVVLTCSRKVYNTLLSGFYGDLVYKGTRLVSFIRLEQHEEQRNIRKQEEGYFFVKRQKKNNPIAFYCDAPTLGVTIPADEPEKLDVDEVVNYINRMFENNEENFFGLDNKSMIIQFFNDGDKDEVVIDIPDMKRNGSHQALIYGVNKMKSIVRAYYNNEDVFEYAEFEFMQF